MEQLDFKPRYKSIIVLLLVLLLAIIPVSYTLANYSAQTVAHNNILFGYVDLDLIQTTLDTDGTEIPIDTSAPFDVTSAATQSRIVRVANIGPHALFIRVKFWMEGTDKHGASFDADEYTSYTINLEDWIYSDGWYYYPMVVQPGESTSELFSQIIFEVNGLSNSYPECNLDLEIYAQGVQSEHQETLDVMQVTGWPEEGER